MTQLSYSHKRFIMKMLALGNSPAEVAEMVAGKFLVQTSEQEVAQFLPGESETDVLSDDLRDLYYRIRKIEQEADDTSDEAEAEFIRVARISDLEGDAHLCVEVDGKKIAVFKSGNSVFALDNTCTHQQGPLSDGTVADGKIECPWHGARFDLETGEAVQVPATEGVNSYAVRLGEKHVEVKV